MKRSFGWLGSKPLARSLKKTEEGQAALSVKI
jgi:hypothetical protein